MVVRGRGKGWWRALGLPRICPKCGEPVYYYTTIRRVKKLEGRIVVELIAVHGTRDGPRRWCNLGRAEKAIAELLGIQPKPFAR